MNAKSKIVDIRLDSEEVAFLKKNEIKCKEKPDKIGNLFSVDCAQLKEKFYNC
jgi:hypothetical protein